MANVKLNPVLEQIHGQIGDLVFKRYQDKVIISRKAYPNNQEPTPAQQVAREHFRSGAQYGKMVMADPGLKAIYAVQAKAKNKPIFSVLMSDYLKAPTVTAVNLDAYKGAVGEFIFVAAVDDFEVTAVTVSLTDGGAVLESGAAVMDNGRWTYTTTTAVAAGTTV
ncbi:MAG: hypothetical protein IAF02_11860, partial [Anaerolineae bacterium]|nr:hypothetical protein [Anaerolineae bacterium]